MSSSNSFVGNVEDVGSAIKAVATVITAVGSVAKAAQGLRAKNRRLGDAVAAAGSRSVDPSGADATKSVSDADVVRDATQGEVIILEDRVEVHEGEGASPDGVDSGRVPHQSETEGAVMLGNEERDVSGDGSGSGSLLGLRAQVAELVAVQGAIIEQLGRLAEAVTIIGQATSGVGEATQKNSDSITGLSSAVTRLSDATIANSSQIARLNESVVGDGI